MKYMIIFSSRTGNTTMLAHHIQKQCQESECLYCGVIKPDLDIASVELIYLGYWTNKGVCDEDVQTLLKSLQHKKIFLFGTAGFGGSQQYFDAIIERVKAFIDDSNLIIGTFMCQGKMPLSVRTRYEQMALKDPQRFQPMIANFDQALEHPNSKDLQALTKELQQISFER